MPLPIISFPTYEVTLPSTKKVIKYRPFLVKEEKLLLIAQGSEDVKEIVNAVRQVINNCILTEDVKIEDLTTFDLEYLFIKIRAKSVNNIIELTYKDLEDDKRYTVEVNLDEVEVTYNEKHTNKIAINDTTGILMKYPKADLSTVLQSTNGELDMFFNIIKTCLDKVYEGDKLYNVSEYSAEELDEFVSSLNVSTFRDIQEFFATMPKIRHEIKYTNSLGNEKVIPLTNITDFFTLG